MKYGLIGKNVSHSYSKLIHSQLDSFDYSLLSLNETEIIEFLKIRNFLGVNVTIPYKKIVLDYLDEIDEISHCIGAVNTIVNSNNVLKGYNTDYFGLKKLINDNDITIENKNCYILGSGGTKNTALKLLQDLKAKSIIIVSRQKNDNTITYQELLTRKDVEVIINTTPVGMFPNIEDELIDISIFPSLEGVIDVIYNPYQTRLITKAKLLGIKACGGLKMLVEQGIKASELFINKEYDKKKYLEIYSSLYYSRRNIVLIGLPMSGKTTIGKELSKKLDKKFVDIDQEIEIELQMKITDIFTKFGEDYFREKEKELVLKYSRQTNLIISCGGGIVKNEENILNLKANGILIYLTRDLDKLVYSSNRPLTSNLEDYLKLKEERENLYIEYKDYQIDNSSTIEECVNQIEEIFYESINY